MYHQTKKENGWFLKSLINMSNKDFQKYIVSKQVLADYVGLIKQSKMTIGSYDLFEKNGRILTKQQQANKSKVADVILECEPIITKLTKFVREYEKQYIQDEYSIKLPEFNKNISRSEEDSKDEDKGNAGKDKSDK